MEDFYGRTAQQDVLLGIPSPHYRTYWCPYFHVASCDELVHKLPPHPSPDTIGCPLPGRGSLVLSYCTLLLGASRTGRSCILLAPGSPSPAVRGLRSRRLYSPVACYSATTEPPMPIFWCRHVYLCRRGMVHFSPLPWTAPLSSLLLSSSSGPIPEVRNTPGTRPAPAFQPSSSGSLPALDYI